VFFYGVQVLEEEATQKKNFHFSNNLFFKKKIIIYAFFGFTSELNKREREKK
jgi:hypothetical protein